MENQDLEHQIIQYKLRMEAIDREVLRLKSTNSKQSVKISNLRKSLYFQIFFFITLFVIFILRGIIDFSGSKEDGSQIQLQLNEFKELQSLTNDSLLYYKKLYQQLLEDNLVSRNETGIRFKVQIGAFKMTNLDEFESDLASISQEKYDSINQYTLGNFKDYQKARNFNEIIKKMGFEDSFVIPIKNGKRVRIENLTDEELGKD